MEWAELDALLAQSDVVCLLADLNPGTRHLIRDETLDRMKPGAFVVNPARGGLVDEDALARALLDGRVAGAALDVFEAEPLAQESPLRELENVILTPHVAGATVEVRAGMLERSFDVLSAAARGEVPDGVLNAVTLRPS